MTASHLKFSDFVPLHYKRLREQILCHSERQLRRKISKWFLILTHKEVEPIRVQTMHLRWTITEIFDLYRVVWTLLTGIMSTRLPFSNWLIVRKKNPFGMQFILSHRQCLKSLLSYDNWIKNFQLIKYERKERKKLNVSVFFPQSIWVSFVFVRRSYTR